ncbi:MAG: hypothetical protein LBT45_00485 [Rickettsiales bacterium]|jgi:hypothetical protein|nr:hypothetical protein [Rickettsiales bacterium]
MKGFLFALFFLMTNLRAETLCRALVSCQGGGDWYSACYGSGAANGCMPSAGAFGTGQSGIVNDCGCGGNIKIIWRCSNTFGSRPNLNNPSASDGQYCWCQLKNVFNAVGAHAFLSDYGTSAGCHSSCAAACAEAVLMSDFRGALCGPDYLLAVACPLGYLEEDMVLTKTVGDNEGCGDGWVEVTDRTTAYSDNKGNYTYTCE